MNNLPATEKTMTIREIADVYGVSRSLIEKRIRELFPGMMQHGKTTRLNEAETTAISIRLKQNTYLIGKENSLERIDSLMGTSYGRKEFESC